MRRDQAIASEGQRSERANAIRRELQPGRLLPGLTAGVLSGVLVVIVEISFASLIFADELAGRLASGIGLTLFGTVVIGLVVAGTSAYRGSVAVPQDAPAVILSVLAAAVVSHMPATASPDARFMTVVAAIVVSSLLTGALLLGLGWFKLGKLIRYVPYPVIGGFLAGTGWLLVVGAVEIMAAVPVEPERLPELGQVGVLIHWLPGAAFGALLLVVLRRTRHYLALPAMALGAIGVFYLLALVTRTCMAKLSAHGWLLGPLPEQALWPPFGLAHVAAVEWSVLVRQAGKSPRSSRFGLPAA